MDPAKQNNFHRTVGEEGEVCYIKGIIFGSHNTYTTTFIIDRYIYNQTSTGHSPLIQQVVQHEHWTSSQSAISDSRKDI
jgi:hypothetical protein